MNLYFPLWLDGGLAPTLLAGARALRERLVQELEFDEVPLDPDCSPDRERGIIGYGAIVRHLAKARSLLAARAPTRILAVGGGCGIEVAVVGSLLERYPELRVLWFDAHGDINSPASSPSGYFHGMPLRFLVEAGLDEGIRPGARSLDAASLRLVGTRDLDPPERDFIRERGIEIVADAEAAAALALPGGAWAGAPVYAHIDLDVIDPSEYPNVKCPALDGLRIASLAAALEAMRSTGRLVGMSLVENTATEAAELARLEPIFAVARRAEWG